MPDTAIKDIALTGFVPEYNGIQFGGANTGILPGESRLTGTYVYDDANRSIIYTKYVLQVHVFVAGYDAGAGKTTAAQAARADVITAKLSQPGKVLKLSGLGLGWEINPNDIIWGPKPLGCEWKQVGDALAAELIWTCEFNVACRQSYAGDLTFLAWNYDTVWQIDDEGLTTRTITGYVQIPGVRFGPANPRIGAVADQIRERIAVILPDGFRRLGQTFHENAGKERIDFSITDTQLVADALPAGITRGSGDFSIGSSSRGFAIHTATLNMSLTTKPGIPKSTAGFIFFQSVLAKQQAMRLKLVGASGDKKGAALPSSYSIRHGLWTRDTQCSFSWLVTGCFSDILAASGIWEPVAGANYLQWRASMSSLWGVRGVAGLRSNPNDDVIIDLCTGATGATMGSTPAVNPVVQQPLKFTFTCDDIPESASWIAHDLQVRLLRKDPYTIHRKAKSYTPNNQQEPPAGGQGTVGVPMSDFTEAAADAPVIEYHGKPRTLVYVQFKYLKVGKPADMPIIKSIAGRPCTMLECSPPGDARPVFDFLACPAYFGRSWALYHVDGHIPAIKTNGNPSTCNLPNITDNL